MVGNGGPMAEGYQCLASCCTIWTSIVARHITAAPHSPNRPASIMCSETRCLSIWVPNQYGPNTNEVFVGRAVRWTRGVRKPVQRCKRPTRLHTYTPHKRTHAQTHARTHADNPTRNTHDNKRACREKSSRRRQADSWGTHGCGQSQTDTDKPFMFKHSSCGCPPYS